MDRTIILIGPMGSGKSAIGQRIADNLGRQFIDTDQQIEHRCGVDIAYIFEKEGESGFRKRETEALKQAMRLHMAVIATGGGIVTQAVNRDLLRHDSFVIYLKTSPEQQYERVRYSNTRPLIETDNPQQKLRQLMEERAPFYDDLADLTIDTDGQRVIALAKKITRELSTFHDTKAKMNPTLTVQLHQNSYPIAIQPGSLSCTNTWKKIWEQLQLPPTVLVISDDNVAPLYLNQLKSGLHVKRIEHFIIPNGEANKHLGTVEKILDHMINVGLQRDSAVIALGGGVVGDIAGFASACYMRGIKYIQVPTTLLAQVDSSVGGKTGVNHPLGKNLIGAFHQPCAVVIDPTTLTTLAEREVRAGIAEVIKYGCIVDATFFAWLENNITRLVDLDLDAVNHAIERSCANKAAIIARDEKEQGERALLNFGHTFGHAIEHAGAYRRWLHGEAVAIGMLMASRLSTKMDLLGKNHEKRIANLIEAARLPYLAGHYASNDLMTVMLNDKKHMQGQQRYILLQGIGQACIKNDCPPNLIKASIEPFLGEE